MSERRTKLEFPVWFGALSPGIAVVLALALLSTAIISVVPARKGGHDASMWTFARPHEAIYRPAVKEWNGTHNFTVDLTQIARQVMDRRLIGGFLGEVPTADLIEAERSSASLAFAGPVEAVGFLDLTDRMEAEGLFEAINPPSLAPWTFHGRVFGLPHDVHPVMLGYRADIVEAAGIDLSGVETWDDLFAALRPLQIDRDGDGAVDRYALSLWDTNSDMIETLMLQAGGGAFDAEGRVTIASELNAKTAAEIVSWMVGPDRVSTDVPEWSATGIQLKLDGHAVCYLMPDWMCNVWRRDLPTLSGKVKLMPLPAFEVGGRRTSVWGGSMLGISRVAENHDELWTFAKHLYFSNELSRALYEVGDIITPIRANWADPIFDEPDEYFGGQPKGRMYIELADDIPIRAATPFFTQARMAMQNAVSRLRQYAEDNAVYDAEALEPVAAEYLQDAHDAVIRIIERNAFHRQDADGGDG